MTRIIMYLALYPFFLFVIFALLMYQHWDEPNWIWASVYDAYTLGLMPAALLGVIDVALYNHARWQGLACVMARPRVCLCRMYWVVVRCFSTYTYGRRAARDSLFWSTGGDCRAP